MLSFPSPSTVRPPESKPSYSLAWSPTQPTSCRTNLLSWTLLVHDPHRSNLYEMQTSAWSLKHKKHNCPPIAHKVLHHLAFVHFLELSCATPIFWDSVGSSNIPNSSLLGFSLECLPLCLSRIYHYELSVNVTSSEGPSLCTPHYLF